jgi:hypothetical protein
MQEHLARCAEHLRKAVRHLAIGPGTPREKLCSMVIETDYGRILESDFPSGPLRDDFEAISLVTR